jgi:hypothetical protein
MAELFIKQAEKYVEGRPNYPPELFEFIASKTPSHDLAWDVGTGNGQAAQSVSFIFSSSFFFFFFVFFNILHGYGIRILIKYLN